MDNNELKEKVKEIVEMAGYYCVGPESATSMRNFLIPAFMELIKSAQEVVIKSVDDPVIGGEDHSDIVKFGDRYFQTNDYDNYRSWLREINKEEWDRLQKFEVDDWGKLLSKEEHKLMENKQNKTNELVFKLKELKFVWSWLTGKLHCGYCQKYKKHLTDYMYFNPYVSCCRECYVQINKENK